MTDVKMQVENPQETIEAIKHGEIDESLYSRQLYVLGHEAMKRMGSSNVLIVGLKGLGVEIAKNIALAGVKSLTLYDPAPVAISDLSSQFFLQPEDVGKPRAEVTAPRVAELNSYVPVTVHEGESLVGDLEQLKRYQAVVLTQTPLKEQLVIADFCHKNKIYLTITDTFGLFGYIFNDFGKNFTVGDPNGEEPAGGIVADIDEEGLVSALDETRHGLEDGDFVTFTEVKGMDGLNNSDPRKVTVKGPYTFTIGDVSGLGSYQGGGLFTQVKMPKFIDFQSLEDQLKKPELLTSDFAKFDRPQQLHIGIQALHRFADTHDGQLPRPHNDSDAQEVLKIANDLAAAGEEKVELDEKIIKELSYQARGDLNPLAAFFGGIAAQEVLKAVSGKFSPVHQWLYFDSLESLPSSVTRSEESCKPLGTRYDGQIAVFGKEYQDKLANVTQFLVGSGAIGCETLKNWAMMGLGTGPKGKLYVTDMDQIEKSNLNRQFLFRPKDVGRLKSECASAAAQAMNPELKDKIVTLRDRVGADTEHIFNEEFWNGLDGVTNALDNVDARTYVDRRCVFFRKPLLESGTLGTKCNTQVVLPFITESYSSSQDPPEKSFPMCTLKSFPNRIEHTIAWARDVFQTYFVGPPESVNMYLSQSDPANQLLQSGNCSILLFASEYRQKAEQIAESQENLRAWEVMDLWKWFDGPSTPKTVSSYCREYTRAKEEETAIILYSSGTTGLPKEIPLPHGYFSALDYFQHLQLPEGRTSTVPWLSEPKHPHLLKTNLFHGSGIGTWAAALFHRTHFVIGPDIPLTAALLKQIVTETGVKTGIFPPHMLTALSSSAEGLEAMAGLRCVGFVGMPLPTSVGDKICQVTRLQSCIGMTEAGYLSTLQPHEPKDWEYFEWNPYHPVEMRDQDCGYFELVIPRPAGRYTQCVFLVLPNQREFYTGDLFIQHPRNPVLWKHAGRHDDVSKLQNNVLLYPCPIEKDLEGHNMISLALLTTDHALRVVLIVDPDREVVGCPCLPEDFVDNIWPLVEEINCGLPPEARITRDHVLVASIDKPFQTTAKGTVRRRFVVKSYSKEIEAISGLN